MSKFDYDLFVIGGGSGGVRAARIAAGYGARVAIAEEFRFGGTCVIRGCVPKKLLVYASRFRDDFEDAVGFGWSTGDAVFDWKKLIASKDRETARLEAVYQKNLDARGVTMIAERAVLDGPNAVSLAGGQRVTAKTILIATGGRPNIDPDLQGCEHVITSNEVFDLEKFPQRVVVAGGGYIAVEFASIFAGLGAETTLVYRGPKVLRGFDDDVRDALMQALAARGIRLVMNDIFTSVEKAGGSFKVHLKSGIESLEADIVLCAIGRLPNTEGLGLERAGVRLGPKARVEVDEWSQTNVPSIYAVGDVTDRVNLTPVAIREGHAFADTVFGGQKVCVDHKLTPTAVFTTPEIGTVGLSEEDARAELTSIDVYKSAFRAMRNTLAGRDERMLMKLVVHRTSNRIVGCHIVGPDAAEIVQMAAIAMRMGATKADFDATMALHPTAAEELVTMREVSPPST